MRNLTIKAKALYKSWVFSQGEKIRTLCAYEQARRACAAYADQQPFTSLGLGSNRVLCPSQNYTPPLAEWRAVAGYSRKARRYARFALTSKLDALARRMRTNSARALALGSNSMLRPSQNYTPPLAEWRIVLAGVAGFGPTNEGVKVPCLTAWLYPYG